MAPTRMKLRVRRRGNAGAGASDDAGGGGQPEEEERRRESGARTSRRKNATNNTTSSASATPATATTTTSSPPPQRAPPAEDASPDSKCPICLDRFSNVAYLDRCLHRFCFPCVQEWSRSKPECPLCKQPFASILHSVVAADDFKEYTLRPPPPTHDDNGGGSVAATVAMVAARRPGAPVAGPGVPGDNGQQQQRDITAESFRRNPSQLHRLRPWLRRELTVLYGAHATLVDIVQRIITARLARHGLEDTPTVEEELRPFLLARTDHFLHELVSFARSPLSLESYDLQAVYEPPDAGGGAVTLDASDGSDGSSVIAISEGDDDDEERRSAQDDVMQTGSCLSLAAWDDETPGPSYTHTPGGGSTPGRRPHGGAVSDRRLRSQSRRTGPRSSFQLSSEQEEGGEEEEEKEDFAFLPQFSLHLRTRVDSLYFTDSSSCREDPDGPPPENDRPAADGVRLSVGFGRERAPATTPTDSERRGRRRRRRSLQRRRRRSGRRKEASRTLSNPNRSIFPAMIQRGRRGRRRSPCLSGGGTSSPDSSWELSSLVLRLLFFFFLFPFLFFFFFVFLLFIVLAAAGALVVARQPSPRGGEARREEEVQEPPPGQRGRRPDLEAEQEEVRHATSCSRFSLDTSGSRKRPSRAERSPSVEIIYEGTVAGNAASPPAAKRRRKPRRHARLSSSPVIITLDSDSSHDDDGGGGGSASSSPLSSQQTVDFSDLPPLPPLRLPVRILDRESDGSDGSEGAHGDHGDHGDHGSDMDVDVENGSSPPGSPDDGDKDTKAADQRDAAAPPSPPTTASPVRGKDSDVPSADSRLLATILDDLEGIAAPRRKDAPFNSEPRTSKRETNWRARRRPLRPARLDACEYALAPRGEPAFAAGGLSADDAHSRARFAPVNSQLAHPNAPSRVESSSASVDFFSRLALDSSKKEELSSSSPFGSSPPVGFRSARTGAESGGPTRDDDDAGGVRSSGSFDGRLESSSASVCFLSRLETGDEAPELSSTTADHRAESPAAGRGSQTLGAVQLQATGSVSSERPLADVGAALLSGVYLNNVSSVAPSPSRSFGPRENSPERLSLSETPTPAPSGAALPFNVTPRRHESANRGAADVRSSSAAVYPFDDRLNHAAESPGESDSRLPRLADSRLKPDSHVEPGPGAPFAGSPPKGPRGDLQHPADNHESRRDSSSSGSDSESPGSGERSARNVWDTHTRTAT
ncbi:hypothetical protein PFLUV_G00170810 [Perca fluviatilis]|uniref:E3 ubiquitin-protein ligase Topors n=1 Tax=Perca fluviatilis TaxID=8168 RepID=A0A6A5EY17_PERFL|nr:hypothetical protein PFLUV_G00170810 [Perca fluviatilis]